MGFTATVCQADFYRDIRVLWWCYLFVWSKVPELIDTTTSEYPATTNYMVTMNYGVHSLMYTYYACMACGWRLSRRLSVCITSLQIVQMFAGFYINYVAMNRKLNGQPCDVSLHVAKAGVTLIL
ncbi:unnamed protein product [Medioppia subpectinata]|uniref:Elongation of very long chain fatty acids protein n=1 Tax=Medioppia subpectinata TaxID=1979941 RepID=A0A7R9PZL5_9ACAR|nr:unnamed protein product [Medioppia subpectinata]CAG2106306.1 unnamed protein product [Medioppia subpectinata]